VQQRAAHVEAVTARARQDPCAAQVHEQAERGDDQQSDARDLGRSIKPPDGFEDDPAGRGEQQHAIGLRAEHLGALQAERVTNRRGALHQPLSDERDREPDDVGQHVCCVGQKGE
jgi:hypothetical protein